MLPDYSEAACRRALAHVHETLRGIPHRAMEKFNAIPDRVALARWPSVRAHIIWAYMIEEADRVLLPLSSVRPIDGNGTRVYQIGEDVVVRFKLVDEDGTSSNYPTQRALEWNEIQPHLDGISAAAMRVDVGYVPNDLGTQVVRVCVARRNGEKVAWMYPIEAPAAVVPTLVVEAEPSRAPRRRVHRRKDESQSGNAGEGTNDE